MAALLSGRTSRAKEGVPQRRVAHCDIRRRRTGGLPDDGGPQSPEVEIGAGGRGGGRGYSEERRKAKSGRRGDGIAVVGRADKPFTASDYHSRSVEQSESNGAPARHHVCAINAPYPNLEEISGGRNRRDVGYVPHAVRPVGIGAAVGCAESHRERERPGERGRAARGQSHRWLASGVVAAAGRRNRDGRSVGDGICSGARD